MWNTAFLLSQTELLVRIGLAGVLGWVIGNERRNRNKSAGTRTHAIVALGAALVMVVSKYGFWDVPDYDAARVAAQVVSGVSFLGAGIIFVRNNLVNGLTTAAGVWATAGVGLAVGSGLYLIGIAAAVMLVLMQIMTHQIAYLARESSHGVIRMTLVQESGAVKRMQAFLEKAGVAVSSVKIQKTKKEEVKLEFEVIYPYGYEKAALFSDLAEIGGVVMVGE